jgi:hypothetical protein
VHANFGVNLYTYNASTSTARAQQITPADRINLGQQVGVGYYVHPNFRLQLTTQFGETVRGLPSGTSPFTLFAIIPWVVFTSHGGFVGVGPLLAPRAFSKNEFELGTFLSAGYNFRLPHDFGFALAAQMPVTLLHRVSVQITPLVSASYRF